VTFHGGSVPFMRRHIRSLAGQRRSQDTNDFKVWFCRPRWSGPPITAQVILLLLFLLCFESPISETEAQSQPVKAQAVNHNRPKGRWRSPSTLSILQIRSVGGSQYLPNRMEANKALGGGSSVADCFEAGPKLVSDKGSFTTPPRKTDTLKLPKSSIS
jgi:hypothetical protein